MAEQNAATTTATTLRLVWPQFHGDTRENVGQLVPEVDYAMAREGYAVGARALDAFLPDHTGPTVSSRSVESVRSASRHFPHSRRSTATTSLSCGSTPTPMSTPPTPATTATMRWR